jgi:hypothetical protein
LLLPFVGRVVIVGLLNTACFFTGYLFPLPSPKKSFLYRIILAIGLGYVVIGFTLFLAGACQLFYPKIIFSIWSFFFIVPLLIKRQTIFQDLVNFGRSFRSKLKSKPTAILSILLLLLIFYFSLSHFLKAEVPRYGRDTYQYHLEGLKMFIQHRGFCYLPQNVPANMPFQMELYQMVALFLNNLHLTFTFQASTFILLGFFLCVYVYKKTSKLTLSLLSTVVFLGLPIIRFQGGTCLVEVFLASFLFLSFVFFELFITERERNWLVPSAIFSGFAVGIKLWALQFLLVYFLLFAVEFFRRDDKKFVGKSAIFFLFFWSIFASPWLIKSFILTGNPTYPYFYSVFGGWNEFAASFAATTYKTLWAWNIPFTFRQFFLSLITFCYPGYKISPVMLLLFFVFIRKREEISLLLCYLIALFLWWWICRFPQYGIPTIPFFLSLAFIGIHNWQFLRLPKKLKLLSNIGLCLFFFLLLQLYFKQHLFTSVSEGFKVVKEPELKEKLREMWPTYKMSKYLNKNYGARVRVAGYNDYFLNAWNVSFWPSYQALFDYTKIKDGKALERRIKELNIDIVVFLQNPLTSNSNKRSERVLPKVLPKEVREYARILREFFKRALQRYKIERHPFGYIIFIRSENSVRETFKEEVTSSRFKGICQESCALLNNYLIAGTL